MIMWWQLPIPGFVAVTNRLWRGEDEISRPSWYAFMAALFLIAQPPEDLIAFAGWMLFIVGYAMFPWQAMFCIVTNQAPGRKDSKWFQWMQDVAMWMTLKGPTLNGAIGVQPTDPDFWQIFGINYGGVRSTLMFPGILLLSIHYHSEMLAYTGLIMASSLPYVYLFGCAVRDHFGWNQAQAIPVAEVTMGWLIGTYMLMIHTL